MSDNAKRAMIARQTEDSEDGFSVAVHALNKSLSRVSRQLFDVRATLDAPTAEPLEFAKAIAKIEDPSLIVLIQADDEPLGFLVLDPLLVNALIELSTGAGERQVYREPRSPTLIDAALTRTFCETLLAQLPGEHGDAFGQTLLPRLHYHAFETDPARLPFILPTTTIGFVQTKLEFQSGARGGDIFLALPMSIWSGAKMSGTGGNKKWRESMESAVLGAPFRLRAVLERLDLPLAEAMALNHDDVLPISAASISNISLETPGGRKILVGRLGQINGRKAIAITNAENSKAGNTTNAPRSLETSLPNPAITDEISASSQKLASPATLDPPSEQQLQTMASQPLTPGLPDVPIAQT